MNNQQFFDKTLAHLREQKVPAVRVTPSRCEDPTVSCVYRATRSGAYWSLDTPKSDTLACAVGAHLPDALVANYMFINSESFVSLIDLGGEVSEKVLAIFKDVDVELVVAMQGLHDHAGRRDHPDEPKDYSAFEGDKFDAAARNIAALFKLEAP